MMEQHEKNKTSDRHLPLAALNDETPAPTKYRRSYHSVGRSFEVVAAWGNNGYNRAVLPQIIRLKIRAKLVKWHGGSGSAFFGEYRHWSANFGVYRRERISKKEPVI
jgi:hypothetical protein